MQLWQPGFNWSGIGVFVLSDEQWEHNVNASYNRL